MTLEELRVLAKLHSIEVADPEKGEGNNPLLYYVNKRRQRVGRYVSLKLTYAELKSIVVSFARHSLRNRSWQTDCTCTAMERMVNIPGRGWPVHWVGNGSGPNVVWVGKVDKLDF